MKIVIIIFLFISTLLDAQVELVEDYSFKKDKIYHTSLGAGISSGMFFWVNNKTNDVDLAFRAAWMSSAFAGLSKEIYDVVGGKEMSIADMSYTTLSGLGTAYIMKRITIRRNKKRAKRDKLLRSFLSDI